MSVHKVTLSNPNEPIGLDYTTVPEGILIAGSAVGSPAARANLPNGLFVALNNQPVASADDIRRIKQEATSRNALEYDITVNTSYQASPAVLANVKRPHPKRMPPLNVPASLSHLRSAGVLYMRSLGRVGTKGTDMPRVVCFSRRFIVVTTIKGEVKRVIKHNSVAGILHEEGNGLYTLIQCKGPEHDLLLKHTNNAHVRGAPSRESCEELGTALSVAVYNCCGNMIEPRWERGLTNRAKVARSQQWVKPRERLDTEMRKIKQGESPLYIDTSPTSPRPGGVLPPFSPPQSPMAYGGGAGAGAPPAPAYGASSSPQAAPSSHPTASAPHGSDHHGPLPPPPHPPPPDAADNPPPAVGEAGPPSHAPGFQPQGNPQGNPQSGFQNNVPPGYDENLLKPHLGYEGPEAVPSSQPPILLSPPGSAAGGVSQAQEMQIQQHSTQHRDAGPLPSPTNSLQPPPPSDGPAAPQRDTTLSTRRTEEIRMISSTATSRRSKEELAAFLKRVADDDHHPSAVEAASDLGHKMIEGQEGYPYDVEGGMVYLKRAAAQGERRAIATLEALGQHKVQRKESFRGDPDMVELQQRLHRQEAELGERWDNTLGVMNRGGGGGGGAGGGVSPSRYTHSALREGSVSPEIVESINQSPSKRVDVLKMSVNLRVDPNNPHTLQYQSFDFQECFDEI